MLEGKPKWVAQEGDGPRPESKWTWERNSPQACCAICRLRMDKGFLDLPSTHPVFHAGNTSWMNNFTSECPQVLSEPTSSAQFKVTRGSLSLEVPERERVQCLLTYCFQQGPHVFTWARCFSVIFVAFGKGSPAFFANTGKSILIFHRKIPIQRFWTVWEFKSCYSLNIFGWHDYNLP